MNAATSLLALTAATVCPDSDTIQQGRRFHHDSVCNRVKFNAHKRTQRDSRLTQLLATGGGSIAHVPNQKTSYCPLDTTQELFSSNTPTGTSAGTSAGLDTVWLVENTASTPVVISFINAKGVAVSALDPSIAPAENDPNAILQPGQWMSVLTIQGHVFTAKELQADGSAGRVLLQHRAGLIPIGERMAGEILNCPLTDTRPLLENQPDPVFDRTPVPSPMRPCNTLDVGFRNMAGCPVNGFYVTPGTTPAESAAVGCRESFKFHLGTQSAQVDHFMKDWTSATKYEGSFVGHTYHFRLAHDPTVLVQSITLQPTRVMDCPEEKGAVAVGVAGEAQAIRVARLEGLGGEEDGDASLYGVFAGSN